MPETTKVCVTGESVSAVDARHHDLAGAGLALRPRDLLERPDHDVRLGPQHPLDRVGLQAADERGDEQHDGHARAGATDDQRRLQPSLAKEAQRDDPLERHVSARARGRPARPSIP
jgi:hypothetical protein